MKMMCVVVLAAAGVIGACAGEKVSGTDAARGSAVVEAIDESTVGAKDGVVRIPRGDEAERVKAGFAIDEGAASRRVRQAIAVATARGIEAASRAETDHAMIAGNSYFYPIQQEKTRPHLEGLYVNAMDGTVEYRFSQQQATVESSLLSTGINATYRARTSDWTGRVRLLTNVDWHDMIHRVTDEAAWKACLATFAITPAEAARRLKLAEEVAETKKIEAVPEGVELMVGDDYFFPYRYDKTEIVIEGYYINGHDGTVEYRFSPLRLKGPSSFNAAERTIFDEDWSRRVKLIDAQGNEVR